MAPPLDAGADRAWRGLALSLTTLTHLATVGNSLLDADRLLLARNPAMHSFEGLAALLSEGRVTLLGAGLPVRVHAPLGALASWLSWQWLRAGPRAQHAVGLALAVWIAASLFALLRASRLSSAAAAVATLVITLHPSMADLTAPLAGRDALLAVALALAVTRRAVVATPVGGVVSAAGVSVVAGLCAPGFGLLGLLPASVLRPTGARAVAAAAALLATAATAARTRDGAPLVPSAAAASDAFVATLSAWLPSATPFVAATHGAGAAPLWLVAAALGPIALAASWCADDPDDAALLRAGAAATLAATLAAGVAASGPLLVGSAAFALHVGVVLAAVGTLRAWGAAVTAAARPWMLVVLALPAAATAHRVRGWSDEDALLRAVIARDGADPEASLAHARLALRAGRPADAAPWCTRYALAQPERSRADGCLGGIAAARGDAAAAAWLLRRWSAGLGDRRALRAAAIELSDAFPQPAFGEAFRVGTGFNLPRRRPGEAR